MVKTLSITILIFTILNLAFTYEAEDPDIFDSVSEILKSGFLNTDNTDAPKVEWPKQFKMKMTTNTSLYNTTLDFKFDSQKNRIWTQVNYTSPIWGSEEAFQLALFPTSKNTSLKVSDECRWAKVKDIGSIYLNLIFSSWGYYTKYQGTNEEGQHVFNLIDYIQKHKTGNVTLFFNDKGEGNPVELAKVTLLNEKLGVPMSVEVLEPPTEAHFSNEDFEFGEVKCEECPKKEVDKFRAAINTIISFLQDFMQTLEDNKLIERAVDTINENIDDKRIPESVRDMLKKKMGRKED
mmetsp:Transcript_8524/g.7545  ORF Transcript_8524/g.7545 Transcript_8524/m.7545 type:complete len:293 (+) Transcript_8524:23-901(+)|eukprot:CAMPEP_0205811860 /NCGR_PEP_ID=MMETSP0205-20121125/16144_1 /ASSEMBLY_ACC=CAM_ASM_000278 /TAXON_ID=36767 /ORGANISM="Euplotes focardii, Strain TN1" /LENGTH=292 /DNA_ID=CAMNT_0053091621 /DNA_START=13 /DNA_END=891 /DNA_ORIENTATION=+